MYIKYLVGPMHDAISICCLNYEYITLELPVGFSICICRIMNVLSYLVDDLNTVLSIEPRLEPDITDEKQRKIIC